MTIESDTEVETLNVGADAESTATGQPEDRGDDFTPTDDASAVPAAGAGGTGGNDGGAADATTGSEEEPGEGQRPAGIPKARFNEVNDARKTAEARVEELQRENERLRAAAAQPPAAPPAAPAAAPVAQAPAVEAFDAAAKEQEYAAALLDGDASKAAKLRGEINAHLVQEATRRAEVQVTQREQQRLLEQVAEQAIAAHPWLNTPEGADAQELILAARDRAIQQGKAPHLALQEAVVRIAPRFAPQQPPSKDSTAAVPATDSRPAAAAARGAEDSTLQPPAVQAGIGNRATAARMDVSKLTDEQFDALSADEKRRLRGD